MLKLENVSKTYLSESKNEVCALKHIDLQLPDSGIVFVVGENGSGKSTLLNVIGGAVKPTHGKVFYYHESFDDYSTSDYDNYRNSVLGFVFNDFNLIRDLNVKENLELVLKSAKDNSLDDKILSALKEVGLNNECLKRKIDELSDGDKQRVAIARALLKDAKLILADEPTKNLDDETAKEIRGVFKNLSKNRLVVVATSDVESVKDCADRIIRLSDGQIIRDESKAKNSDEFDKEGLNCYFNDEKPAKLSKKICLKLSFNNFKMRVGKTISLVLLSIVTVFLLVLSQMLATYSTEAMMARFIKNNDIKYFKVVQGEPVKNADFETRNIDFQNETLVYVYENSAHIYDGEIDGKQDILDFGLTFVGETVQLKNNAFYITDFALEKAYEKSEDILVVDGKKSSPLVKELYTAENIVGKSIKYKFYGSTFLVAGVIDTSSFTEVQRGGLPNAFYPKTFIEPLKSNHFVLVKTDSIKNLKAFLIKYRKDYNGGIGDVGYIGDGISQYGVEFEFQHYVKPVLYTVTGICLTVLFLSTVSLISRSIKRRKKDICVLSALGMGKKEITKIFLTESLLISAVTVVLDAVIVVAASHAFNEAFKIVNPVGIPYMHPDVLVFIGLVTFAVVPIALATLAAANKLSKMKLDNQIKGL